MCSIRPTLVCCVPLLSTLILALPGLREQAAAECSIALRLDDAPVDREVLRYGDKDFGQWCQKLRTELKPEVRIEGVKALGAFGVNGYAEEATTAICELMRGYDVLTDNEDDAKIAKASLAAIEKIGGEAVPALKMALKNKKRSVRRFAAKALLGLDKEARTSAAVAVAAALGDTDWWVIAPCMDILKDVKMTAEIRKTLKSEAKKVVPALIRVVKDDVRGPDYWRQMQAATLIGICGPDAKEAVPTLIERLGHEVGQSRLEGEIVYALGEIGPAAKAALPVLKSRYGEYLEAPKPASKESKPGFFSWLKPAAAELPDTLYVMPAGLTIVDNGRRSLPQTVKDAVKKIEGK